MSITKRTTYQVNCDKSGCQISSVDEDSGERSAFIARLRGRGWFVALEDQTNETVLCPRCKPVE